MKNKDEQIILIMLIISGIFTIALMIFAYINQVNITNQESFKVCIQNNTVENCKFIFE